MNKFTLFHRIYGLLFNFFSVFRKPDKNTVALVSMHNENFNDSLGAIFDELKKDSENRFMFIDREALKSKSGALRFFFKWNYGLAGAGTIFLNDNFLPMAFMKIKPSVKVVQLWHGEGVFKKFGLSIEADETLRSLEKAANKRLTHVITTSAAVAPLYAEAFGVSEGSVLPLGSARTDCFFDEAFHAASRLEIEKAYPGLKGKKLVLYAPTFRSEKELDDKIAENFDFERVAAALGSDHALLVRLHPQIHSSVSLPEFVTDMTGWRDVRQLCAASEMLITDYSSICMSFALMDKPTVFYAYDLDYYKGSRDFYFDYESYVPGPVAKTTDELIAALKTPLRKEKLDAFKRFNFDHTDGKSAKRIAEAFRS